MAQENPGQNQNHEIFSKPPTEPQPQCPQCSSKRLYRDGLRYLKGGSTVQRWLCRDCGYRFSQSKCNNSEASQRARKVEGQILNLPHGLTINCQGSCEAPGGAPTGQPKLVQTLATVESRTEKRAAGATAKSKIEGDLINFAWWLKKQGRSDHTIRNYVEFLKLLTKHAANLMDPETVRTVLARLERSIEWKHHATCAYSAFLKMQGLKWDKPEFKRQRKIPFIPLERELDDLISASGKKTATFLQLLKETGMRAGEALRLKWTDIDYERNVIILNQPEKGGNPRIFKVSYKLIGMLNALPRKHERVFPATYGSMKHSFILTRKKAARNLQNPRLLKISFHTFRHWKATMEYHKTKDPLYVKELLGHKKLDTTLMYIQIERTIFKDSNDEFTVKIAKTPEEIKTLLEVGFNYVCEKDGLVFLRKRK